MAGASCADEAKYCGAKAMTDDEYRALIDRALSRLTPAQRLAGLTVQERLEGLTFEEKLLCFPDDELRLLPEDFLATFSESFREAVRKRIGK
jgi:hypothetical protein